MRTSNILFVALFLLTSGCVTAVLNNTETMSPPQPDPLRFSRPVCVQLEYFTDSLDFLNRPEGRKPMLEDFQRRFALTHPYYNISTNCDLPDHKLTLVYSENTRNWWARSIWLTGTILSLGIIPFYVETVGEITVMEDGVVLARQPFVHKRLSGLVALPKWLSDTRTSVNIYRTNAQAAHMNREEAAAIWNAVKVLQEKSDNSVRP